MSRPLLLASIAVALMIGCRQHAPQAAATARTPQGRVAQLRVAQLRVAEAPPALADGASAERVVAHLTVDTVGGAVRLALAVRNASDRRLELDFPDGQTHDFAVRDAAGRLLWRWSAGRLFTQTMQNRLLEARDSVVYAVVLDEAWAARAPGEYVVVAELRSENHPVRATTRFALR